MRKTISVFIALVLVLGLTVTSASKASAASSKGTIGVNVLLNTDVTDELLGKLAGFGKVNDVIYEIDAVTLQTKAANLTAIQALPFVVSATPDAVRNGSPIDTVAATDFSGGMSTWDMDAVNVTDYDSSSRTVAFDGTGVYVAVLDTGLVDAWRQFFPQERIATEYAIAFGGGGGENGNVSEPTNKWEHDQNSHGTHVTSTILGYSLRGTPVNGVAPMATVIPVKVLNQNGSGWSSVIARGIMYVAELKEGPLAGYPVVINMSLGGSQLDPVEKLAIDYAISKGVIIVASAGNEGTAGMGYPGAYEPVISVAATGWSGEWSASTLPWWYGTDVPEVDPVYYITDFSSRQLDGQDLDVAAPGSWIVGPYMKNSGQISYYFLGGTSMASPHVAGIVALMAQKYPALTASQAENILEVSAVPMGAGSVTVMTSSGASETISWDTDATGAGYVTADAALNAVP